MSPAEKTSSQANTDQIIETIYTTVETQPDRTDWLTVVSNLRQINRQLVEEIARLEQALASAKQTVHTHKEQHQIHEITILQQQDELKIAKDRLGSLFQQLETSHQIGQRQQTLIETLSQQLEIVQTIVPQIEAEHEELRQKYQQQSQKLVKTERVAIELHRRLKLQTHTTSDAISADLTREIQNVTATVPLAIANTNIDADTDLSPVAATNFDSTSFTTELDPAPPSAPRQIDPLDLPNWTSPSPSAQQISSISNPAAPTGWREAILQDREARNVHRRYNALEEAGIYPTAETIDKESTSPENPISQSSSKWPSPTILVPRGSANDRDARRDNNLVDRPATKAVKIDLPKFPKKPEN